MKTAKLIIVFLLLIFNEVEAQQFEWAHSLGYANKDGVVKVEKDHDGNFYSFGYLYFSTPFDPDIILGNDTIPNFSRIYSPFFGSDVSFGIVIKTDKDGNYLWNKIIKGAPTTAGRPLEQITPASLSIDDSNNVVVAFNTRRMHIGIDDSIFNNNQIHSSGYYGHVMRLNSKGEFDWVKSFKLSSNVILNSNNHPNLHVESSGNSTIVFANYGIGNNVDGNIFNISYSSSSSRITNSLLLKLNTTGVIVDTFSIPVVKPSYNGFGAWAGGIYVDSSENIYITAKVQAEIDTGGTLLSNDDLKYVIVKLDSGLNKVWYKFVGTNSSDYGTYRLPTKPFVWKDSLFVGIPTYKMKYGTVTMSPDTSGFSLVAIDGKSGQYLNHHELKHFQFLQNLVANNDHLLIAGLINNNSYPKKGWNGIIFHAYTRAAYLVELDGNSNALWQRNYKYTTAIGYPIVDLEVIDSNSYYVSVGSFNNSGLEDILPSVSNLSVQYNIGRVNNCLGIDSAYFSVSKNTICIDEKVTLSASHHAGFQYHWYFNNYRMPTESSEKLITTNPGNYRLVIEKDGCKDTSDSRSIVSKQNVQANLGVFPELCSSDSIFVLNSGAPLGGAYYGYGVQSDSIFNASITGKGNFEIKYVINDTVTQCSDTARNIIKVGGTQVYFPPMSSMCESKGVISLNSAFPKGGQYFGKGISNNKLVLDSVNDGYLPITYVVNSGNCSDSATQILVVDSSPIARLTSIPTICENVFSFQLNSGSPAGGTYYGTGVIANSFYPIITKSGIYNISYVVQYPSGCKDTAFSIVQIDPSDTTRLNVTNTPICNNSSAFTLLGATPWGGKYYINGVEDSVFKPSMLGTGNQTIQYKIDNTCLVDSSTQTLTIEPAPIAQLSLDTTSCIGTSSFNLSGGQPLGGSYSVNQNPATNFNSALLGVGSHIVKYKVSDSNSCLDSISKAVQVFAQPVLTFDSVPVQCNNATLILSQGKPSGGNYTGTGVANNTFNGGVAGVGVHSLKYLFTDANNCSDSIAGSVEVIPPPSISHIAIAAICENTDSLFLSGGSPTGGKYEGLGVVNQTKFLPALAGQGLKTIYYTYESACGKDSVAVQIQVHAKPLVSLASFNSLTDRCANSDTIRLTGGLPSGGQFTGIGVKNDKFDPAIGSGNYPISYSYTDGNNCSDSAIQSLVIDSVPIVSLGTIANRCLNASPLTLNSGFPIGGVYSGAEVNTGTFIPTSSGTKTIAYNYTDAKGCKDSITANIQVDSVPVVTFTITNPTNKSICQGLDSLNLTGGQPTAGMYQGPGVSQNAFFPDSVTTGKQGIEYSFTDGNGCSSSANDSIQVHAKPNVSLASFNSLSHRCANSDTITLSGGLPTGGHYSGTGVQNGKFNPAIGSGNYPITYSFTDGNNCTDSSIQTLAIDSVPTLSLGTIANRCLNANPLTLTTGLPIGGVYSGAEVNTGTFIPTSSGTKTIAYKYTDAKGCNDSVTANIQVDSVPLVTFTITNPTNKSICQGLDSLNLSGGQPTGGSYQGQGVNQNAFFPDSVTTGKQGIEYTFTDGNGCSSSASDSILVHAKPTVSIASFNSLSDRCANSDTITLIGGLPTGGQYFGTGVQNGNFDPAIGSGNYPITYSYTDGNNCTDSATQNIEIDSVPSVSLGTIANRCLNASPLTLNSGFPIGGVYSGAEVNSGTFTPTSSGTKTIAYNYTDAKGCKDSVTANIQVDSVPLVTFTINTPANKSICQGLDSLILTGGFPIGGMYQGQGITQNAFFPDSVTAGKHGIDYTFTDGNGCFSSANDSIIVHTKPTVSLASFNSLSDRCANSDTITLTGGLPTGGQYSGIGVLNGKFDPTLGKGNYTISYSYIDVNSCTDSVLQSLEIDSVPSVSLGTIASRCLNANPLSLTTGLPQGGLYSGSDVNAGLFTPMSSGTKTINYQYRDAKGCIDSVSTTIQVDTVPILSLSMDSALCKNTPVFAISVNPLGGVLHGKGVAGNSYDVSLFSSSNDTVKYGFTDGNSCTDSIFQSVGIDTIPAVQMDSLVPICDNIPVLNLTVGKPQGGTYSGAFVSDSLAIFSPILAGTGVSTIHYSYTDGNQCSDSTSGFQTVIESPKFNLGNDTLICALNLLELSSGLTNGQHKWNDNSTSTRLIVTKGGTYSLSVTSSNGCVSHDTIVVSYEEVCAGIETDNRNMGMTVFPNPTKGNVMIAFGKIPNEKLSIEVMNSVGQVVYNFNEELINEHKIEVPLRNHPNGVYYISVISGEQKNAVRVVKVD